MNEGAGEAQAVQCQKERLPGKGQRGLSALFSWEPLAISALKHRDVPDTSITSTDHSLPGRALIPSILTTSLSFLSLRKGLLYPSLASNSLPSQC